MEIHFFLECVSVCLEELFEDVVDHIADTARLALRRQMHEPYRLNELRLYADFEKSTAETTPRNLTMFIILPDRDITKIAETILVSAICGFLPVLSVIRLGLEPRTPTLKVLCSTN